MTSIHDPRSGYNAKTGKVEEFSLCLRPQIRRWAAVLSKETT